jgi:syndecan 1
MITKLVLVGLLAGLTLVATGAPADAQRIKKDSLEKTRWHNAPREFQIIDDRPIIRDFREAPQEAGTIELPPAPTGAGGGGGGGGGGAMGGAPSSLPSGGLQLGGPNQGFRSAPSGLGSLPKSGFGGTNIPARGMAPKSALPSGSSTNRLMGKMNTPTPTRAAAAGAPAGGMSRPMASSAPAGPVTAGYGGGYGSGGGAAVGSSSRTDTAVRGTLLRRK